MRWIWCWGGLGPSLSTNRLRTGHPPHPASFAGLESTTLMSTCRRPGRPIGVVERVETEQGAREAIERVYRERGGTMWRAILGCSADPEIASDAVAEAFAQLLRRGAAVRDRERWAWRAAFRIAAGELKNRRRESDSFPERAYEIEPESMELALALANLQTVNAPPSSSTTSPTSRSPRWRDPRNDKRHREGSLESRSTTTPGRAKGARMTLDERIEGLKRTPAPDLWPEIERREPITELTPVATGWRRLAVVAAALAIGAAAVNFVVRTYPRHDTVVQPSNPTAANGVIAYAPIGEQQLFWTISPDGSEKTKVPVDVPGFVGVPSWSPDGSKIAFAVNSYDDGQPRTLGNRG